MGDASNALPTDRRSPWFMTSSGSGAATLQNARGGVVQLDTGTALANDYCHIDMGLNAGTQMLWWNLAATPWAIGMCRFKLPALTNIRVRIGFFATSSGVLTNSCAYVQFDSGVDATNFEGVIRNSGGTAGTLVDLAAASTNYHTCRIASVDDDTVEMQIDNGTITQISTTSGTMASGGYTFGIYVENLSTTQQTIDVDQAFAGDGVLASDMAPNMT
jgi:hypothetical protein